MYTVEASIRRGRLLAARDSVLVAVSGGPDSVALLAAMIAIKPPGWRVGIGHVDHHLRGRDSDRDRDFVMALAKRFGCEAFVADAPLAAGANLEERARERRYEALSAIAEKEGFRRIATAHTLDDQAETVLHRMLRGTGGAGLAAIARDRGDGVIRPLLDVSRAEILAFLRRRRLRHRLDRTNASARFTRNRLRHRVLPVIEREVNPAARRALARLAELAREDEQWLERAATRRGRAAANGADLDARALGRIPLALRRRVIRKWLGRVRGNLRGIDLDHVERLDELASSGRDGQRISIPGGTLTRRRGRLAWNLKPVENGGWRVTTRVAKAASRPGRWRAVFDAAKVEAPIRIRVPRPGDRIRPIGLGGSKKLQDVFVDAKIPREERAGWPVVAAKDAILWLPGLVRSDVAPVGKDTRRYLVVEARRVGP